MLIVADIGGKMEIKLDQELSSEFTTHEELTKEGLKLEAVYNGKYGKALFSYELSIIELLKAKAKETDNKVDDTLVALVEAAL